jgi:hypothetical protein
MMLKHNAFYGYVIALAIVSSLLAKWLVNEDVERRETLAHSADFFSWLSKMANERARRIRFSFDCQ